MKRHVYAATFLAGALLLAACSSNSDEDQAGAENPAETEQAAVNTPEPSAAANPGEPEAAPSAEANGEQPQPAGSEGEMDPIADLRPLSDWYFVVVVNPAAIADPHELEPIGREICEGLAPCRAAMWYDARIAPQAFPVDEDALLEQVFAFGRTIDGSENILWNCNVFPEFEAERSCLPRLMN